VAAVQKENLWYFPGRYLLAHALRARNRAQDNIMHPSSFQKLIYDIFLRMHSMSRQVYSTQRWLGPTWPMGKSSVTEQESLLQKSTHALLRIRGTALHV
jgi:hypothetical protein